MWLLAAKCVDFLAMKYAFLNWESLEIFEALSALICASFIWNTRVCLFCPEEHWKIY
jgi:hypothetical protein